MGQYLNYLFPHLCTSRIRPVKHNVLICKLDCSTFLYRIFVLAISSYIDRVFYGRWTCVHYNFLEFNVLSNLSTFYGSHPWHWYLSQGFPIIMGTHIFPFVMAARRNIQTICLGVIGWTILVYRQVMFETSFMFMYC